ncbi:MAG: SOS response-associated peptidase [Flavobacteriaceae bacterium]|nr:SOS response-associated peptidase [Flavobacteriaceae bacterium]
MCYDVKAQLESQLKRAYRNNDPQAVDEIKKKLAPLTNLPLYHVSGFQHPVMLIYTNESPYLPVPATWGLIPHWVRDNATAKKLWNQTLNARGQSIFEKPSFRDAAKTHRCLIYVDGFYEHHHLKSNTYPYYIHAKNEEPMALAGLWSEWANRETGELVNTFSIVTTLGNPLMEKIHNNPKLEGPRMPLILPEELTDKWLVPVRDDLDKKALQDLIRSYPQDELDAYTVHKLRGKDYLGNVEAISEKVDYPELQETLF